MAHSSGLETSTPPRTADEERIDREREFHNLRFATGTREAQDKYYYAIEDGKELYLDTVRTLAAGADVLEYGCANGIESLKLAPSCRSIVGIDISDVAVAEATRTAELRGITNARFLRMNAERMEFPDDSFDLVFGAGIIHHLDVERAYGEIARVLRPGGTAVFWEPLGHNPLINFYRNRTPEARTADEHPLRRDDFRIAERHFRAVNVRFYGLTTLASVPFRNTAAFRPLRGVTRIVDRCAFLVPGVGWYAWYALIRMKA